MIKILNLVCIVFLLSCQESPQKRSSQLNQGEFHVIYEKDSRENLLSQNLSSQAQSTGLIVAKQYLKQNANGDWQYPQITLRQSYPLCENEHFKDEKLLGFCSGVLISPRHILTAGHCIKNEAQCQAVAFIFGHTLEKSQTGVTKNSELYKCQKLISRADQISQGGQDFAVILLDRDVSNRTPVKIADSMNLRPEETVLNFSYPLGLPLKSDLGKVIKNESWSHFIEVSIDTFSGSSGSGLFNREGQLVGILSRGSEDFLEDDIQRVQTHGGCLSFNRCQNGTCRGERFFRATLVPLPN